MEKMTIGKTRSQKQRMMQDTADFLRYILGHRAKIGQRYDACIETNHGYRWGISEALFYDEKTGTLIAYEQNKKYFLLCSGDMAVWRNVLYAERIMVCLGHKEKMTEYVLNALRSDESVDLDAIHRILRAKYPKVPPNCLRILARYIFSVQENK